MPEAVSPFAAYCPVPAVRRAPAAVVTGQAGPGDVNRLAALQAGVRGGPVPRWAERIARALHAEQGTVAVARVDGGTAGYAAVAYLPAHPVDGAPAGYYLTGVTVAPEWRRRGVGAALTRWRTDWAARRGAAEVWCLVSARNRASLDLHRALGFAEVRRADVLQGVAFEGGAGILPRARCRKEPQGDGSSGMHSTP